MSAIVLSFCITTTNFRGLRSLTYDETLDTVCPNCPSGISRPEVTDLNQTHPTQNQLYDGRFLL